ncbi:hypothetical protein [Rhodopirellula baltica]|uniref:Uncharacterized protein n=1 Tax=Rhodopirellula baltica WH47 TaxID=991778 RepID=F2APF1_RHOBT|nr:hypothetical protein [Rhodopirellula baltica]EGF28446.1 conserved hypothetical protein, membrane [Rhodopirellula baltica WH47]
MAMDHDNQDAEQLRLLSIFHYIVAGMLALFSLFPVIHLAIGVGIVTGVFDGTGTGETPPAFMGWLFIVLPLVFIAVGLTMASCIALAGRKLMQRNGHLYCLVVAGIECCFFPFGTVLGVLTILVLLRPSVKQAFGVADSSL